MLVAQRAGRVSGRAAVRGEATLGRPDASDRVAPDRRGGHMARPSSSPPAGQGRGRQLRKGRVVDKGRLRDVVTQALLLLLSVAVLVVVTTVWGLSARASVLLALVLLVPGLLWLALRP